MVELGHLSLICGFVVSGFHAAHLFFQKNLTNLKAKLFTSAVFGFYFLALMALVYAHVGDDFSVISVAGNSHSMSPLLYKIAGVWGYHQGSALLWAFGLSICGVLFLSVSSALPGALRRLTTAIQSGIVCLYGGFLVFTSNPFLRHVPFPAEGLGLNLLLQDPGLAYHPPTLFGGHVFLSIVYSLVMAMLLMRKTQYLSCLKPWVMLSFAFLTLGIMMGSFWAYYVLGWGGWWFWDPVEVLSLLPWLVLLMLIHGLQFSKTDMGMKTGSVFLAMMGLTLSIFCTFIVRSGMLTSVHTFSLDPKRGGALLAILLILLAFCFLGYGIYTKKKSKKEQKRGDFTPKKTLFLIVLGHILAVSYLFLVVLTGIFGPLVFHLFSQTSITLGPDFYQTLLWGPLVIWLLLMAFYEVRFAGQKKKPVLWIFAGMLSVCFLGAFVLGKNLFPLAYARLSLKDTFLYLGVNGLGLLIILSGVWHFYRIVKNGVFLQKTAQVLSHLGVGLFMIGLSCGVLLETESYDYLFPQHSLKILNDRYTLEKLDKVPYENTLATRAHILFQRKEETPDLFMPERQFYYERELFLPVSSIFIRGGMLYNLTLGEPQEDGSWQLRVKKSPLLFLVWSGAILIFMGCLLGFFRVFRKENQ